MDPNPIPVMDFSSSQWYRMLFARFCCPPTLAQHANTHPRPPTMNENYAQRARRQTHTGKWDAMGCRSENVPPKKNKKYIYITQVIASSFASCVAFLSCVACDVCFIFVQSHLVGFFIAASHTTRNGGGGRKKVFFFLLLRTQSPNSKPTEYTQSLPFEHHIT